jgi:two-component system, OmpR family, KDP operon response regulator KdpE
LGENQRTVLVVDDELAIRKRICVCLTARGYSTREASTGRQALDVAATVRLDVIVLDLGLPDIDGIEVVQLLRRSTQTPIIILSVRDSQSDKVAALEAGADEYLTKPCESVKLLERIGATLLREGLAKVPIFNIGDLSLDLSHHVVQAAGKVVELTESEYELLRALAINAGRLLTQRHLIREVWGELPSEEGLRQLRSTIHSLRQKLEPNPTQPRHIGLEPGVGYRLWTES